MNSKAQAGLEYLMTYGWALILVATIVTVLVFVVGGEKPGGVVFVSSDPTKIMLKAGGVSGDKVGLVLQNATGGRIIIKSIAFSGDLSYTADSKLNGQTPALPLDLIAGGEIRLEGLNASNGGANGGVTIQYKDYANFDREVSVASGGGAAAGAAMTLSLEGASVDSGWAGRNITQGGVDQKSGADCVSGKCLLFDASGDEVSCGDCGKIANASYSYTAWIKPISLLDYMGIVVYDDSSWRNGFVTLVDGKLSAYRAHLSGVGFSAWSRSVPNIIASNQWQFVAVSFDTAGDRTLHLYLNGKEVSYVTPPTAAQAGDLTDYSTNPIKIGGTSDGAQRNRFRGYIDEVHIYGRALNGSEICNECKSFSANIAAIQPGFTCTC